MVHGKEMSLLDITTYMLTFVYIMYIKRTGIDKYYVFARVGVEQWFSIFCGREPFIVRRNL